MTSSSYSNKYRIRLWGSRSFFYFKLAGCRLGVYL